MKRIYWKTILPAFALVGLCGCGTPYTFSPYVGQQQNWSTGPAGYVKLVDGAQLYAPGQYPPQPYVIIGAVTTDNEHNLARAVRDQHADAALISSQVTVPNGRVAVAGGGVFWSQPLMKTTITANLIQFRRP